MAGNLKGLTIELNGDTTKLSSALESVNKQSRNLSSELGQVNKLLKMDPGNADLLAQKQDILAEAVENTSKKLETLKEAERQVQAQFERGEVSADQVRALQREIVATEQKLDQYKNAAKETAEAIDDLGQKSGRTAQETADLKNQLADVAGAGLKGIGAAVGAAAGALTAAAESTREYRTEMGKLDTAFTDNGFSADAAKTAYREMVGVLGETDQAVEASNHLAKLTDNEKDLATWTGDILPGVFATFGASLPIEGLTEAANETAKVGQVTGPLADALNWAGISEDKFNESLAKCTTEQERQKLIMETLSGVYGDASAKYKETNADVIAANQANDAWTASLAQVGAAVEPVLTSVKSMGAELLSNMVPAIQAILNNLPVIGVALAGTAAAVAAFKLSAMAATAATQGMTLAQKAAAAAQAALNVVMSANPIGLVILAITALVAAFMLLWNNSESFREFWIGLWEKIKTAALNAAENLNELPEKIYNAIKGALDRVKAWGEDLVKRAKTAATNMLNNVVNTLKNMPSRVYSSISGALERVQTWGSDMVNRAKTAASNMLSNVASTLSAMPGKVYSAISGAIQKVTAWGSSLASKGSAAAKKLVTAVTNGVKSLPSKMASIGKNLVQGLWNGISNMTGWIISKIGGFTTSVLNSIKSFFGIASPSRVFRDEVGKMLVEGIAVGITSNTTRALSAVKTMASSMTTAATTESKSYTDIGKECVENIKTGLEENKETAVSAMQDLVDEQFAAFKNKNGTLKSEYKDIAKEIMDSYTDALDEGYDRAIELIDKRVSELASTYQEKYNAIISARDDMEKKLVGADDLFTFDEDGRVILANIDKDIKEVKVYEEALTELQERFGVSQTLLAEITKLGIEEGTAAAKRLLRMTDEEFEKFNRKWEEKQKLAKAVAEKFYSDQIAALDVAFNQKLNATLSSVPDTMKNIGVDSMQGWIDGMNSSLGDLEDAVARIARRLIATVEDEMGIASPSKEMAWIGDMIDRGLEKGLLDGASNPINAMRNISGWVLDAAKGVNGLALERSVAETVTPTVPTVSIGGGLGDKLDRILAAIERGQILTIDGAALVGATADRYDATLGQRRALAARGAV